MYSIYKQQHVFSLPDLKRICERIVSFMILCIFIFSLISSGVCIIVFSIKYPDIFSAPEIVWCLPAIILFLFISSASKFLQCKSERFVIHTLIAVQILLSSIMILSYNTQPCSDYAMIWNSANEIAQGTFTSGINPTHYMYYYNWQLGITVFESLLIRLGFTFAGLKVFNAIILMIIQYMEYYLVKKKWGFSIACTAYTLSTFFLPWCLTIPQFTNHHIGLIFLLLTLCLLEQPKAFSWFEAGIILAVMNVLRPLGIIVLLAAICYSIYLIVQKRSLYPLFPLFCLLVSYSISLMCFNTAFIHAGYTDAPISQARIPYFKFQKGLYGYNHPFEGLKSFGYDYDAYNAAMKQDLLHHISTQPLEIIIFIANKMVRYLGLFDYQFEMTYNHDVSFYTQYPVRALYILSWFQYIGFCLLALRGYLTYRKQHPMDVFQIFFIGNTLVYFLIEAFSSYRFESYPFLIMLAAVGLEQKHHSKPGARI